MEDHKNKFDDRTEVKFRLKTPRSISPKSKRGILVDFRNSYHVFLRVLFLLIRQRVFSN